MFIERGLKCVEVAWEPGSPSSTPGKATRREQVDAWAVTELGTSRSFPARAAVLGEEADRPTALSDQTGTVAADPDFAPRTDERVVVPNGVMTVRPAGHDVLVVHPIILASSHTSHGSDTCPASAVRRLAACAARKARAVPVGAGGGDDASAGRRPVCVRASECSQRADGAEGAARAIGLALLADDRPTGGSRDGTAVPW
jgi:hypothetical protein